MILKSDERSKVIILLMACTGMRLGAIPYIRYHDLTEVSEHNLYRVQFYARTRDSYYSFCTPECRKAIDEYITFREVHGETVGPESFLVRSLFDVEVRLEAASPKPLKMSALETIMYKLLLRSETRSSKVMRNHGLRKFFVSQCIKARMDYNTREYLIGHKHSRGLDISFDRTTEEDRLA